GACARQASKTSALSDSMGTSGRSLTRSSTPGQPSKCGVAKSGSDSSESHSSLPASPSVRKTSTSSISSPVSGSTASFRGGRRNRNVLPRTVYAGLSEEERNASASGNERARASSSAKVATGARYDGQAPEPKPAWGRPPAAPAPSARMVVDALVGLDEPAHGGLVDLVEALQPLPRRERVLAAQVLARDDDHAPVAARHLLQRRDVLGVLLGRAHLVPDDDAGVLH